MRKFAVEFQDKSYKFQIESPLQSLEALRRGLQAKLKLDEKAEIEIEFFDEEFEKYFVLEDLEDLTESSKILRVGQKRGTLAWEWNGEEEGNEWKKRGYELNEYFSIQFMDNGVSVGGNKARNALERFKSIFSAMGGDLSAVNKGFAISNKTLFQIFEGKRSIWRGKLRENANLFIKKTWPSDSNSHLRRAFIQKMETYSDLFPWNLQPGFERVGFVDLFHLIIDSLFTLIQSKPKTKN